MFRKAELKLGTYFDPMRRKWFSTSKDSSAKARLP